MAKIMPYKRFSKSAFVLRKALGFGRLKIVHPDKSPRGTELVINWGCTKTKPGAVCSFLNKPEKVAVAVNKLETFNVLKTAGIKVPEFTTDVAVAKTWIESEYKVLARFMLRSHSGNGIRIIREMNELPTNAPLYVRYFKKKHEYRVHVLNGQVIDFVEKKKRSGLNEEDPGYNKYIRSYNHGWVFCREGVTLPDTVKQECIKAVQALGLDFGAVDVGMNERGKIVVFEVNCAPALEGTTVQKYAEAFNGLLR